MVIFKKHSQNYCFACLRISYTVHRHSISPAWHNMFEQGDNRKYKEYVHVPPNLSIIQVLRVQITRTVEIQVSLFSTTAVLVPVQENQPEIPRTLLPATTVCLSTR